MKKLILFFVFSCLIISLNHGQTISTTNQTLLNSDIGTIISVPINASNITSSYGNTIIATIRIVFNQDVLQYIGYNNMNPIITSNVTLASLSPSPNGSGGVIQFNLEESTFSGFDFPNGKCFDLRFTYKGGYSPVTITVAEFLPTTFISENAAIINGSISGPTVPITSVLAGGLWSAGSTWDLGHTPNASNGEITIASTTPVNMDVNVVLNDNLILNTGAALTVNSGKTLDVNGKVFTVKSDASFINNGTITGNVKVERLVTGDKWHLMSSPVTNATANVFHHTQTGTSCSVYLRDYNQGINDWAYVTDVNSALVPAKGYGVWADILTNGTGNPTVKFIGPLNSASSIPYTSNGLGWNLLGNPYTSALDWNTVTGKANISGGAFYCWNSVEGKYSVSDGQAGVNQLNIVSPYIIPAMQGFFVKATAAGSLGISTAKIHSAVPYYKSSNSLNDMVRLTAQRGLFKDEALVVMNSSATNNYDEAYDASKFFANNTDIPEIYTLAGSEKIAINKIGSFPAVVPVNIKMGVADNVTITASDFANFDASVYIILEDMLNGTFQNLRQNPSYTFSATIGENAGRFNLHFSYIALGIDNLQNKNANIYSSNNTIYVNSSEKINDISVYNMLGQLIVNKAGNLNAMNTITVQAANAYYIVKVTTVNGVYTEKVYVK